MKQLAIVFFYNHLNRYSFHALAGALESQPQVAKYPIYFYSTEDELLTQIPQLVLNYEQIVLGLSFFTTQIWEIRKLIENLRQKFGTQLLIFGGGPHPSGDPEGSLRFVSHGLDGVIIGEGEETFIDLISNIAKKKDWSTIKGIGYLNSADNYIQTPKRPFVDLNQFPALPITHHKYGPIEITRGCPFCCYFCQTGFLFGTNVRHRSISEICKYVQFMANNGMKDIRFITPNALSYGSPDGKTLRLDILENLLIQIRNIIGEEGRIFLGTFPSEIRPEHVTLESLRILKTYTNNKNLIIGAQSGSPRMIEACHRGHQLKDVENSIELTLKAGFKVNVDIIFGLPGETQEDQILTINFMKKWSKRGIRIHAHTFLPLPKTPFARASFAEIDEEQFQIIQQLASNGIIYGDWIEQAQLAQKIRTYLQTGQL